MTDLETQIKQISERNMIRAQQAKEKLGERYLLHPKNKVQKKPSDFAKPLLNKYFK